MALHVHTILTRPLRHHTHSTPVSTNNPTLQHTPQDEGDQTLYDTINDTVTNLDHNDTVQCVKNELVGQRNMDTCTDNISWTKLIVNRTLVGS